MKLQYCLFLALELFMEITINSLKEFISKHKKHFNFIGVL